MSPKRNICIINSVYKKGSTGRIVYELSNHLEKQGFSVNVFFGRPNKNIDADARSLCFANSFSVCVHALLSRIFDKSGQYSKKQTKQLIKAIDKSDPDLVIIHNLHGYYINFPLLLKHFKENKIKVLAVFHDCWNFTGHCAYFDYANCDKWKTGCHDCPNKREYPASLVFDNSKNNYFIKKEYFTKLPLTIVCPSEWLSNIVRESFLKDNNIYTIHNGIDLSLFKKTKTDIKEKLKLTNKKIILCVSYVFDKRKGINDVLLLSKMLNENEIIIIIGKIPNAKKLPNNIIHINKTDDINELINYYSIADVFFNPTLEDNFPTVNLEAIACECPVICYDTGGSCEIIDSRFAIKKGDVNSAYELMNKIFKKEIIYDFSNREFLSKELTYDKYIELINSILNNKE